MSKKGKSQKSIRKLGKPGHKSDSAHTREYSQNLPAPDQVSISTPTSRPNHPGMNIPLPDGGGMWGDTNELGMMNAGQAV